MFWFCPVLPGSASDTVWSCISDYLVLHLSLCCLPESVCLMESVLTLSVKGTNLRNTLNAINDKAESVPLSQAKINTRILVVKELTKLEYRKIIDLRQKAKIKWALDKDEPNNSRPTFPSNLFKRLSHEDTLFLDHPFTNQEIKDAVWDCGPDKSPGSDNFTFKFIKNYWNILEKDIISYVKESEVSSYIPRGCNPSFVTLIAKVDDPIFINDFRPISLIGCQYKVIAKILANRLALVIFLAKKHKKRLLLIKVDFEKAFDTLSWAFLNSIMSQMGFSSKWLNWIISCLNSAYALVLINGSPSKEFKVERGLRQARDKNMYKGIEVVKDKVYMSHLQFVDDALFFGEWSLHNAKVLSRILSCFHLESGIKVNLNKRGLGVGSLRTRNQAMLCKWWWRYRVVNDATWCNLIRSIHGVEGGFWNPPHSRLHSSPWRQIVKLENDLVSYGISLSAVFKKKISNGCNALFCNLATGVGLIASARTIPNNHLAPLRAGLVPIQLPYGLL
ncbi:putative RNA-directed DNA polymerase, eukaryota, reverse transcriptase zinc-binding domain protein [Tanacetum coccineum]